MRSKFFVILLFSCFTIAASAQQCTQSTIYFDFNKSELKKGEKKKLDSLAKAVDTNKYLIELAGHTDSVNTEEFNQKLAEARIKSVETYLKAKKKKNLVFKQFNRGESKPAMPNDTEENMAKNRRVEIYLLSVQNDKFVFQGDMNEAISIPADMTTPCSVCEALKFEFINTDKEATDAGLSLKSSSGRELTTAGMAQLSFDCPEKAACLPIELTLPFPTGVRFECLSAGTLRKGGSWEKGSATFQQNNAAGTLTALETCYKMGTWTGFLKPKEDLCKHQVNFPADLQVAKTKVYAGDSTFYTEQGQMPLTFKCGSSQSMLSWASADKQYYFLKGNWRELITKAENTGNCDTLFTYNLAKENYQAVPVSDSTLLVKFKGFDAVKSPGFYIEELELALPLELVKKTTYTANYLNYEHTLRFEDDKVYNLKYSDAGLKTKYKKGKQTLKVTVKKKKLGVNVTVD